MLGFEALGVFALGQGSSGAVVVPPTVTIDTHDGFDPYVRKRRAKRAERQKDVEDTLARVMGLVPEDAPAEIAQAAAVAQAVVERVTAPADTIDYTVSLAALDAAALQIASLERMIQAWLADIEEDDDFLLLGA
jgi:hypothetical protein